MLFFQVSSCVLAMWWDNLWDSVSEQVQAAEDLPVALSVFGIDASSDVDSVFEDSAELPAFLEDKMRRWVDGEEAALVKKEGASSSSPLAPIDALGYEDKEREL